MSITIFLYYYEPNYVIFWQATAPPEIHKMLLSVPDFLVLKIIPGVMGQESSS